MLLLLRFFPFLTALILAASGFLLFWLGINPVVVIPVAGLVSFFLISQLAGRGNKQNNFWVLFGIPGFFVLSFFTFLLFLENESIKIVAAILGPLLIWLFLENLFYFNYLPRAYQVNALEYLSLVINVTSVFFVATSFLAAKLFLALPIWLLVLFFVLISFFLIGSTFWVCKIEKTKIFTLALAGSLLAGEIFTAVVLLPVSFFASAAFLTVFFYLFFGLLRAHFFGKLSRAVRRRYILVAVGLAVVIIVTARWT